MILEIIRHTRADVVEKLTPVNFECRVRGSVWDEVH